MVCGGRGWRGEGALGGVALAAQGALVDSSADDPAVAQLLGFFDGAGEADTKKAYQTLLAIRKRRNTHHSGEQELGTHCDRKGEKKGERHEWPWYWRFRQPGCDDAYTGEETFPGLLAFDVDTQCRVVQVLEKERSALRAGLKSHPGPEDDVQENRNKRPCTGSGIATSALGRDVPEADR